MEGAAFCMQKKRDALKASIKMKTKGGILRKLIFSMTRFSRIYTLREKILSGSRGPVFEECRSRDIQDR